MKIMVSITTQTFLRKSSILTVFVMCLSLLPTSSAGKTKDPAIEFDNINKEIKDSTPEDLLKIRTETGKTLLILAAAEGWIEGVQLGIMVGIDVNAKDNNGDTALMLAAYHGHLDIAKLLIENKADVTMKDNDGWTALICAAVKGHTEIAKLLLNKGADVNAKSNESSTALMFAARKGHADVVKLLIDKGADVYAKDEQGWTVLVSGAVKGHERIVELLEIAAKSDIDYTALGYFYKKKERYDEAMKEINKALSLNPQNPEAIGTKAEIYLRQGNIEKSKELYKKAFELKSENLNQKKGIWENYSSITWYALLIPDFLALEKYVKEGLSMGSKYAHPYIHANLGLAYLLQDKKSEAMAELKIAIEQDLKINGKDSTLKKDTEDNFPILKLRYPDKTSLIEWAEEELGIGK